MTTEKLNDAIANALLNNELVYFYQPKVSLLQGRVCGVEALIRWIKPNNQILPPSAFIPAAEVSGIICDISLVMLDKLISDFALIQKICPDIIVSFNVTVKDLASDNFVNKWNLAVNSGRIDPRKFQIEITESMLINSFSNVKKNIDAILDTGASLAMDDLGAGHSTLDVLSKWPFSVVKIDQGLISRMHHDDKNATIVRNTIYMAHQLGLKIVAEGVETEEAYNFLLMCGCTEVQGYLVGMPMPLDQFLSFLRADRRWPASPIGLIHMAQSDHLQWRRQLIDYTISKLYDLPCIATSGPMAIELDPHRCLLGQWYYGLGRAYCGCFAYDSLESPHNLLHDLGEKIQEALAKKASRSEIISLLLDMTKVSGQIISLLQELELEALLERETGNK